MTNAVLVSDNRNLDQQLREDLYRFRYHIFHEKLGWDIKPEKGMDKDEYDRPNAIYLIARNAQRQIEGCWRFLPTLGSYMLRNTFPQLLNGELPPEDGSVWEISRFAITPKMFRSCSETGLHPVSVSLLLEGYHLARKNGVSHFVAVMGVAMEKLLKRAGIPMRRFGTGQAHRIGKVLSVACWIDANEEFYKAVNHHEYIRNYWENVA